MTHPAAHPEIEVVFGPGPPGRGGGQSGSPDAIIVAELYGGTAFRRVGWSAKRRPRVSQTRKETTVHKGIVKWFNPTKGYGFIARTNGGKDVFIHISAVERAGLSTLAEGQNVTFDIVVNRGKEAAANLKVAR